MFLNSLERNHMIYHCNVIKKARYEINVNSSFLSAHSRLGVATAGICIFIHGICFTV